MIMLIRTAEVAANRIGRTRPKGTRPLSAIDALILHQAGFSRGSDSTKYDKTNSHFVILPDGTLIQLHAETTLLWASNRFNSRSVAVEFIGNFPNDHGRCWHADAYGSHIPSQRQIESGRWLIGHLQITIGIRYVFAHRQAQSPRKANCPGPHIWYNVGEWAVTAGLSDGGTGYCLGDGDPIPDKWRDPEFNLM